MATITGDVDCVSCGLFLCVVTLECKYWLFVCPISVKIYVLPRLLRQKLILFSFTGGARSCSWVHIGEIRPGGMRGNHRHRSCNETFVIWGAKTIFRVRFYPFLECAFAYKDQKSKNY